MKITQSILLMLMICTSSSLFAQTFTDLQNGFPSLTGVATAWGDYDLDGDPDFAVIGFSSQIAEVSRIYRNDGAGVFVIAYELVHPVSDGGVSWGDYDHDNDPDLLVNGQNGSFGPPAVTTIYRNDGQDVFTPLDAVLPGMLGVSQWIDYDSDGWLDVLMIGLGNSFSEDSTRLFHNEMNGTFAEILSGVTGYFGSYISVVDFDGDGDQDYYLTGGTLSSTTFPVSNLYRNEGNGVFEEVSFPFLKLSTGTSAWADYDHDGDPDLLYDGIDSTASNGFTVLYRNEGAGNFSLIDAQLPGSGEPGSVDWADIDHDGDLDILLGGPITLLRNDGNDQFTDITPSGFMQGVPTSFSDIDGDGDDDILIISQGGGLAASTIWRNDLATSIDPANADESLVTLYPNPAKEKINIDLKDQPDGLLEIEINTLTGMHIGSWTIYPSDCVSASYEITGLAAGLYFYTIKNARQVRHSGMFVVE